VESTHQWAPTENLFAVFTDWLTWYGTPPEVSVTSWTATPYLNALVFSAVGRSDDDGVYLVRGARVLRAQHSAAHLAHAYAQIA
jgi:hypothetical protein